MMKQIKMTLCLVSLIMALIFLGQVQSTAAGQMDTSRFSYDIEAQSLKSALEIYQKTSGLNLAYSDDLVQGKMTDGVDGKNTTAQALKKILKDTGLTYTITNQGTVVLRKNKMVVAQREVEKREAAEEKEEVKRPVEMEQMVVTATKTPIKVREVPASVNVVTWEDMKLKARTDNFYDAIRHVPGVFAKKEGFQDRLYIRGKAPSMQVNGRDMNAFISGTSMLVGSMNLGMGSIERIEVLKGPQAAIHGSKATSGLVNVILKKGDKDHPYVESRGFYGEGDEVSGGLSLSGGYDKLSYFLDLSAAEQDEYKTPEGTIPFMDYKRKNIYSRFDYAFSDDHEITLEYTHNDAKNTLGGEGYCYEPTWSKWVAIYSHEPEFSGGFLTYNGDFSDWFSLYTYIGMAENECHLVYGRPNYEPEHFLNKENTSDFKEDILQGEIRGTLNLLSDNRLRVIGGMEHKKTDVDVHSEKTTAGVKATAYDYKGEGEESWSPYVQVEFKPIAHVLMVAGVRYDNYETKEKDMSETSPNVGLSLFPFAHTDYNWSTIWASYSEAFLTPQAQKMYTPWGNPDLNPEESEGWEFGLKQRISQWANMEFSYFETDYENLIQFTCVDPVNYIWKIMNIGQAEYEGYELLAEVYPTNWLTLHFGYTDIDRTDKTTGKKLYGIPDKIYQYGLTVNDLYGFYLSLWGEQDSDYIIDAQGSSHPSEDDIIWNTKLLYRWNITEKAVFEPFVFFENLTDKKYYGPWGDCLGIMEGRACHVGASLRVNF